MDSIAGGQLCAAGIDCHRFGPASLLFQLHHPFALVAGMFEASGAVASGENSACGRGLSRGGPVNCFRAAQFAGVGRGRKQSGQALPELFEQHTTAGWQLAD